MKYDDIILIIKNNQSILRNGIRKRKQGGNNAMRSFIGQGTGNAKNAVQEATRGLESPEAIIFIAPYDIIGEVADLLKKQYPNTPSIGTIGTKLVNGQVGDNNISVLGLFSDAKVRCGVIENISECPVVSIGKLEKDISAVSPGHGDTVCLEYCTGEEEKLVTTFTSCFEKKGIQLAGGTTFGAPEGKASVVAYNGKIYGNACVYALIKNTTGKVRVYKENIYKKQASNISHFATKVDTSKKALVELDGKPAAEVYSQELGISKDKIIDNVLKNPMGRAVGDEVFISSMMSMEPNGTLINYKRINKNDCIYFLELGEYQQIEQETRNKIQSDMNHISLVVSIDCIYRYLLYDGEGYFATYAKDMASLGNHMGVVGGGEQCNNQHVNQTMVCAVFE